MGRNPLKKFLYNYTSHLMVSSSLTFESPWFKALRESGHTGPDGQPLEYKLQHAQGGEMMNRIAEFLFETMLLKRVHRTGYQFLGPGKESVAEHTFGVMCIAWTLAQLWSGSGKGRLLAMCLVHDLPEARMGDLNAVQKHYVAANEKLAVEHMTRGLPFGPDIHELIDEFNARETLEARLANDADQLAFLLDLKSLSDMGYTAPEKWAGHVNARLQTDAGKKLSESISKLNGIHGG
jgi:putative hydrolase of HD superfamily